MHYRYVTTWYIMSHTTDDIPVDGKVSNYYAAIYLLLWNKGNGYTLPYELLHLIMLPLGVKKPTCLEDLTIYHPSDSGDWFREVLLFDATGYFRELRNNFKGCEIELKNLIIKYCSCEMFKKFYERTSKNKRDKVFETSAFKDKEKKSPRHFPYRPESYIPDERVVEMIQLCNTLHNRCFKLPSKLEPMPMNKYRSAGDARIREKVWCAEFANKRVKRLYYRCLDTHCEDGIRLQLEHIIMDHGSRTMLRGALEWETRPIPVEKLQICYNVLSVEMYQFLVRRGLVRYTPEQILSFDDTNDLSEPVTVYLLEEGYKPLMTPHLYHKGLDHPYVKLHFPGVKFKSREAYYERLYEEGVPLIVSFYDEHLLMNTEDMIANCGDKWRKWWRKRIVKEKYRKVWFPAECMDCDDNGNNENVEQILAELGVCYQCFEYIRDPDNHPCYE